METTQGTGLPVQAPLHWVKVEPVSAVGVSATGVPVAQVYSCVQSLPQLIPGGFEVTVPVPLPALPIVRVQREAHLKTPPSVRA
jgi:hypothetical protein